MATHGSGKLAIKKKVDRFVEGRRSPRDLDAIFLWIRSKSYGAKTVKDIGDFVGHAEEKNQGIAFEHASLAAAMLRYAIPIIQKANETPDYHGLQRIRDGIMAAFKFDTAANVRKSIGVGQKDAKRALASALSKITIEDGEYVMDTLTNLESKVYSAYSGVLNFKPAYTEEQLATDFATCLQKNGLLADTDVPAILAASQYIAVYAIEKMHLCKLLIEGFSPALLTAGVQDHREGGFLSVIYSIDLKYGEKSVSISSEIFMTTCRPTEWVDPNLCGDGQRGYWTVPIELGPDGKLTEVS